MADSSSSRHLSQMGSSVNPNWGQGLFMTLVGPHVLSHGFTGNHFRDFLLHGLPKLLEDVPLAVRARMWYMHDGAPAHFSHALLDVLNNNYRELMRRTVMRCEGHFENLFIYNSQIKYFRAHVDMETFLVFVSETRTQSSSAPFSYILYT
jgi:hypothetical protein